MSEKILNKSLTEIFKFFEIRLHFGRRKGESLRLLVLERSFMAFEVSSFFPF